MMIQQLYGDNPLLAGWIISVQLLKDIEENIVVREQTNFVGICYSSKGTDMQ